MQQIKLVKIGHTLLDVALLIVEKVHALIQKALIYLKDGGYWNIAKYVPEKYVLASDLCQSSWIYLHQTIQ